MNQGRITPWSPHGPYPPDNHHCSGAVYWKEGSVQEISVLASHKSITGNINWHSREPFKTGTGI